MPRGNPAQYALIVHDHSFDRLAQSASYEHLLENLDIGQFGHFGSACFAADRPLTARYALLLI